MLVCFIAYLPISSFQFFLKNDAFNGYFPPKFFLSESLHAGYLPFWNPYINYGYPLYGDMSSGIMSPITWLIAATVGYNAYSFTLEVLLYLFIGGMGMYQFARLINLKFAICLMAAIAYMCCGYNTGHLQHFNWLSGAAFLPWCLWAYHRLMHLPGYRNLPITILLFYLFISSAHPGIIVGAIYFFVIYTVYFFLSNKQNTSTQIPPAKALKKFFIFLVLLLLTSSALIVSYMDIVPHFVRGDKNSFEILPSYSSSLRSWVSMLLPLSIAKGEGFFVSDLSLRNCFVGMPVLLFFLMSCISPKTRLQKFLFGIALFFFVLSVGGWAKDFLYRSLPLLGYVRLNGEFRLFTLFAIILIAALQADAFFKTQASNNKKLKTIFGLLLTLTILALFGALYFMLFGGQSILNASSSMNFAGGMGNTLKSILDNLTLYDCIALQAIIQIVILLPLYLSFQKKQTSLAVMIGMGEMIITALLIIPFTGAGKTPLREIQQTIQASPAGIPIPLLQSAIVNDSIGRDKNAAIGSWSMYSKQIGSSSEVPYPIKLNSMKAFFDMPLNESMQYANKPFLYLKNNRDSHRISLTAFEPNQFTLHYTGNQSDSLIVLQNSYPYWEATIDGNAVAIQKEGPGFMKIALPAGTHTVQMQFNPVKIKYAFGISIIAGLGIMLSMLFLKRKITPSSPSSL